MLIGLEKCVMPCPSLAEQNMLLKLKCRVTLPLTVRRFKFGVFDLHEELVIVLKSQLSRLLRTDQASPSFRQPDFASGGLE